MRLLNYLRRVLRNSDHSTALLAALVEGMKNQSELQNRKLSELIALTDDRLAQTAQLLAETREGIKDQSELQNRKLSELIALTDDRLAQTVQLLAETRAGIKDQSDLQNRKLGELVAALDTHVARHARLLEAVAARMPSPPSGADGAAVDHMPTAAERSEAEPEPAQPAKNFREAMGRMPLLIAERTYNTSHPDYDANLVRNIPGRIFGRDHRCDNPAFLGVTAFARYDEVPDSAWDGVLGAALVEATSVPGSEQVFERRAFIERYMADLSRKYHAHYIPGWINLDDALFLYWLVRRVKPRTIVQAGVCNGLSAAFMMLALAKNGPEGRLHVIDLPPVFDPNDPAWTVEGRVYGVVIPEGKTTGWIVPDIYRDRFEVQNGDAKELLPRLVEKLDSIDLFYHDSDHTYDHMMFEFGQAKRKLRPGGVIVADDISWNASLWDFADSFRVPSYNFKGAVGVGFF